MKFFRANVMNIRMMAINGEYCYINQRMVIHATGIREYLKYKFLRHTRITLGINLLSISRIDEQVVERVRMDAIRYTPNKVAGVTTSAVAELMFRTGQGRDQYIKDLVKDLKVVADGGIQFH